MINDLNKADKTWQNREEVPGITIDEKRSKDLDDAIWVEKIEDKWKIIISIANVGLFVKRNSSLDTYAFNRAFTQYHFKYIDTMLPEDISTYKASLLEKEERPVIAITITLSDDFEIEETSIARKKLISKEKMNYFQVDYILKSKKT